MFIVWLLSQGQWEWALIAAGIAAILIFFSYFLMKKGMKKA